jgi:prolipoprotein diacylglyceryltransferase
MIICAFLAGRQLLKYFFKKEGRAVEDVEEFSFYVLIACLIGARLGEVLFYNPIYYLTHPLEAILPVTFSPSFKVVGYKGLSYHGAILGSIIGTFLYSRYQIKVSLYPPVFKLIKRKEVNKSFLWLLSPLALAMMMGFLVRIGNFINSEIIGTPTHSSYGVFFAKSTFSGTQTLSKTVKSLEILKDSTAQPDSLQGYQPIILQYTFANTGVSETTARNFVTLTLSFFFQLHLDPDQTFNIKNHLYVPHPASPDYTITKNTKGQYVARVKAFVITRHPVQLYESFSYLITLILVLLWWNSRAGKIPDGMVAGLAMVTCYSFRFLFEFFKDPFNVLIPGQHPITMGHLLSFITVLGGILIIVLSYYNSKKHSIGQPSISADRP